MGKRSSISVMTLFAAAFWASVVVVAAQSSRSTERFTFPGQASNESCTDVDCQQGTCVPNEVMLVSILFPYKCDCKPGWVTLQKITPSSMCLRSPATSQIVGFSGTLNANCAGDSPASAPSPLASPITSAAMSICLVPGICGRGTCESSGAGPSSYKCVCEPGYENVLGTTGGYCVNQCELNGGCENLNVTLPGLTAPPPPPATSANQTANTGYRGLSLDSGLCIATALAVAWSFYI